MSDFTDAVYERLAGDADLCALLATYRDAEGTEYPAVFTDEEVPPDAERPYLWVQELDEAADNVKNARGRSLSAQIGCYVDAGDSTLDAIKERVYDLFDGHKLALDSATSTRPIAVAVTTAPTDDSVRGKIVGLTAGWFNT